MEQQAQQQQMLPPFRLYALIGCPACTRAQEFLLKEGIPYLLIVGNDDPIAQEGVKIVIEKKTGIKQEEAKFPVLVCVFNKQIVEGFKEDEYRKLADAFHVLFGSSALNVPGSGQQSQPEVATATVAAAPAN